jgi:4-amino-4-deoxy-L-arabinose transferase-like glycosyltransferase
MRREVVLAVSTAFVLLTTLISPLKRELYIGDETKYAQIVREMRAGAFFVPTLEGAPFTHKPPVHFWLVSLLTHVFGLNAIWPYVLPSLAAFAVLLWLVRREGGALAALVCGSTLMLWMSAQSARMDVLFTLLRPPARCSCGASSTMRAARRSSSPVHCSGAQCWSKGRWLC